MLSLLLSTKCDQAITQEAATTGHTHIAPSADRTRNEANYNATFLISNMMPQVPELNRPVWHDFRKSCCN
ncbi:DNA/RNA non-specific endonuclease [Microcoleus sp. D3_18_C4]|uniref:DNA/RNA non-specific endonuclease n=1 Tax=Microcoleus sp. D3_18_C4 TaxID=3055335 RepID=UPI0040409883